MTQKKTLRTALTIVQLLAVPFLVYYSFYWRYASSLVATQGYLEAMRRGWVAMKWYFPYPCNIIILFTILPLLVLWLKSSRKRRWNYYGIIVFLSVCFAWLDEAIYSSYPYAEISLTRKIVPWVLWALVMAFLFVKDFWLMKQEAAPQHPATQADAQNRT